MGQLRLLNLRDKKKRLKKVNRASGRMGHHQADEHTHCGSPRKQTEKRGSEGLFEK